MTASRDPEERFLRMTTRPVDRLIPGLAVPTMVSMMVTAFYNMADTYFVGRISTSATGAVGIVFPLMTILQVIGMTLGVGSGSFAARQLGARRPDRAADAASTAFFTALICGLLLTVAGEILLEPFMLLLGSTPTILPYAAAYGGLVLTGAPFVAASFVMNVNLRSEGSAVLAMIGISAGAVVNIALDPLFMFVLGMGIRGAAAATVLSQILSFAILLSHYRRRKSALRITFRGASFSRSIYAEILAGGLPTLFRQSVSILGAVVLNTAARTYGDAAVAGMSVVTRIMLFMTSAMIGFGQGFQPVAAFNYAAGLTHRVRAAFWYSVRIGALFLSAFSVLILSFAPEVLRMFRDDPEVIRIGARALRFQAATLPLTSFIVISNMMFQYIGKPVQASVLALSRQGLAFVPAVLVLSRLFGLAGIQVSQSVADLATFLAAVPLAAATLRTFRSGNPARGSGTGGTPAGSPSGIPGEVP